MRKTVDGCDFDWIDTLLAVGACPAPGSATALHRAGIRRVIDLRAEREGDAEGFARAGILFLQLPTDDQSPIETAAIDEGVAWAREALERREAVLVHCQHGIGRSAMLACCILVSGGATAIAALRLAKAGRAKVYPSPSQLAAFLEWSVTWRRRTGRSPLRETLDDLANVAYGPARRR